MSLSITAVSFGIRRCRVVTAAAEAAHVSTDGRVFLAVQKTALLKTSEEAVLGCLSTAVHGRVRSTACGGRNAPDRPI